MSQVGQSSLSYLEVLPIFYLSMLVHICTGVVQLPSWLLLAWSGKVLVWFRISFSSSLGCATSWNLALVWNCHHFKVLHVIMPSMPVAIFVQASVHHSVPPRPMDVDVPPKPVDVDMPPKPACENRCSGPFCNVGPTAKLRRCSGCLAVKYCSPSCQQSAWVRHKNNWKPSKKQRTDNDKPIPELVDDAVDYCLYLSLHLSINYGFWHTGVLHWLVLFVFWCTTMCACSSLLFSSLLWVLVGWL